MIGARVLILPGLAALQRLRLSIYTSLLGSYMRKQPELKEYSILAIGTWFASLLPPIHCLFTFRSELT